ncbi:MAG: caspase family protein [Fidelibacterota bacterium]|nr:MAG: caspase family protein [Candidatus Neomarinimicrobiota bacterium]
MILKESRRRGPRGLGIRSFFFALPPTVTCLLLLASISIVAAQSPELVQAKARVKALNNQMGKLDETIEQELEATLAEQTDTSPKGEFETTAEYQARLAAARDARQSLEPEYKRRKADRHRAIEQEIETLTSVPYPAPIRIRLGTYDADAQTFPFHVRATGDSGTIEIPRAAAREIKTELPTLKQTGWWQLLKDGTERLAAVAIHHKIRKYVVLLRKVESDLMTHDEFFTEERLVFHHMERVRLTPPVRLTLTVRDDVVIQPLSDGQRGSAFNLTVAEARIWTLRGDLILRTPAIELLRGDLNGIPIDLGQASGIGALRVSPRGEYEVFAYAAPKIVSTPLSKTLTSESLDKTIKTWLIQANISDKFLTAILDGEAPIGILKPSLPPALAAVVTFSEPSGDNVLDANEQAILEITLTNTGQGAAYGVEMSLMGEATGLSFPARRYVGEIAPGKSQQVSIPIKAGLDLPTGQATLTCAFTEANGFEPDPVEITFETRAYQPPALAVADVGVDEPSGNGMIEPGEVVTIMVRVQNRGAGTAEETKARVNIGKNVFAAAGSETEFDLGTLPPGTYRDIQFQIYTNRRAREIPVSATLTERHGKYGLADAPLELPFNQPVRSIQQVVVEGKTGELTGALEVAGGLSVDIERDIPQGRDRRRNAVALIIANRRYLDPDVPDVTYAHRDGEFIRQYLMRTLGYREGNIFLYRDATLSNFRTALKKLRNAARRGSDVFVYYTGHGAPDPDEKAGYFVPVDCDPNYVKIGGVPLEEFYAELGEIRAGSVTVVIDACFSGASAAGMLILEASPIFISVEDPTAGLKEGVVLTSASGDQISSWHPEQQHSLYTYYFLKGLQGAADANGDRSLTVGELQAYLEEQVPYMARRLYNRTQTPTVTPGREEQVLVRYK